MHSAAVSVVQCKDGWVMEPLMEKEVISAEQKLKASMIASDVALLDELLSDDLVFINHFGYRLTKQDDIEAHRSGLLSIESIVFSDLQIKPHGDCAMVYVNAEIKGQYDGVKANGCFAFTRLWQKLGQNLQVVSAHSTLLSKLP